MAPGFPIPVLGRGWNMGWFCIYHAFGSFSRRWSGTTSTMRTRSTILVWRWSRSQTCAMLAFRRLRWVSFLLWIMYSTLRLLWRRGSWMTYHTTRWNASTLCHFQTFLLPSAFPFFLPFILLPSFISWFSFSLLYSLFFLYFIITLNVFLTSWFIFLLTTHFIRVITVTVSCILITRSTMTCLWFGPSAMIHYWWRITGFVTTSTWFFCKLSLGMPSFNFRVTGSTRKSINGAYVQISKKTMQL